MLTLFTWGYWGWGNATQQLVEAVDLVERERGFEPPIFVDIRWSRSVRALGFRDRTFEGLIGPDRYQWMRALGNHAIGSEDPGAIVISDPGAAADLLDLAMRAAADKRRIIFYCACERPRFEGKVHCHRDTVAKLVLGEAKRRGESLTIIEWPGGDPFELVPIELEISSKLLRDIVRGRTTIPLEGQLPPAKAAAIPHCTIAVLRAPDASAPAIVGPAAYRKQWVIPIEAPPVAFDDEIAELEKDVRRLRREWGFESRSS